jgi:hypothetical protein
MACSLVSGPGITAITGEDIMDMDAATAGATTDAATMGVATTAEMATDPDTVIEGVAALQVAAAIAAGSLEVDFAAMEADSTAEIAVDSAAEAFMAVADSTAAVIAVEDPTVAAIGNLS